MIGERIVISDTNILLDLISQNMLGAFFSLPYSFCTTDFVVGEIERQEEQTAINGFIESGTLEVVSFDSSELGRIADIYNGNNNSASFTDCSVWYYAKKVNGRLLTGDGALRKSAERDNVKVSGILYVFDKLVEHGILNEPEAAGLLGSLMQENMRLPKGECEKRIMEWGSGTC